MGGGKLQSYLPESLAEKNVLLVELNIDSMKGFGGVCVCVCDFIVFSLQISLVLSLFLTKIEI